MSADTAELVAICAEMDRRPYLIDVQCADDMELIARWRTLYHKLQLEAAK
jgi:hypothetical protein